MSDLRLCRVRVYPFKRNVSEKAREKLKEIYYKRVEGWSDLEYEVLLEEWEDE